MVEALDDVRMADGHVDMNFLQTDGWMAFDEAGDSFFLTMILIGDAEAGPGIFLTSARPGLELPGSFAHAHASDNWRISLLGDLHMGPDTYGPGEFRLQEGWKVYPSDDNAHGPDGGWEVLLMADRRGTKVRPAVPLPAGEVHYEEIVLEKIAKAYGFAGDVFSDDPALGAGPSAIASTIGPPGNARLRMGRLNESFANADGWTAMGPATRAAVTLLGDRTAGPVLVLAETEASRIAAPGLCLGTELMRVVVDGSCRIGDRTYRKGDIRLQQAGAACPPVEAGENGLKEIVIIGDRRHIGDGHDAGPGWPAHLPAIVQALDTALKARLDG